MSVVNVDTPCYSSDNKGRQIEDHALYSLSSIQDQHDDDGEVTTSLLYDIKTQPVVVQTNCNHEKPATKTTNERKPGVFGLFRYATACDVLLILIGLLFSVAHGASFPLLALVFGQMTNTFILHTTKLSSSNNFSSVSTAVTTNTSTYSSPLDMYPTLTADEFSEYMAGFSMKYLYIGLGVLFAAFVQTWCWEMACERQIHRLRQVFLSQILRQDISWFDVNKKGDLTTKLSDDIERIREGIGSKFSIVIQYVSTFLSGIIVGLLVNWKLTTLILCIGPLLIGTSAYMAKITASSAAREQLKYSFAGRVAEEVLNCIRTVAAFGGEMKEVSRYSTALEQGRKLAMRKYYTLAIGLAVVFFIMYTSYGAAFWYGSQLIGAGECTPGSVFTVFFSVMAGAFSLGNALPFVNAVSTAIGAASTIFSIINRKPEIDPYSDEGLKPNKVNGCIKFENVTFCYPARPEVKVLKGLSFAIEPGKTVALVGPSGAGKSTVVSLLLRFYDPTSGRILLDSTPINEINLHWLRSQIGIVSQEPVLFGVSIAENIRYGKEDITQLEIEQAAAIANAHSFIQTLPQKYETLVGERGTQLSGGQKQRIAIARALVKDPKILLLDEATSALDIQGETVVQDALDKAMRGRTTLIIAHRLSTVKNADIIYAMKDGVVVERGTHSALMDKQGLYYSLVVTQANETVENDTQNNENTGQNKCDQLVPPVISTISSSAVSLYENFNIRNEDLAKVPPQPEFPDIGLCRLMKLNAPEWLNLTAGILGCAMMGSVMPIYAFFYGEVFSTFTLTGEELKKEAKFWTMMFLLLACLSAFSSSVQILGMTTSIEKLMVRIRLLAFTNITRQSIGWFDMDNNSAGRLITRLAREAPLIKSAAGVRAGQIVSSMVTLLSGIVIAILFGWKLALLLLVAVPCLIGAAYEQTMVLRRYQRRDFKLMDDAGKVASECVQNIRTVQSLAREQLFTKLYMDYLVLPYKEAKKQCFTFSVTYALSQAVIYIMYAAAFRFGAYLVEIGDMTPTDVYRVFFSLAFCATSVGQASAYIQDYTKAKMAAGRLFQLIERKSDIDATSTTGSKPVIKGKVTFDNVHFAYPSRPDVNVLRGLSYTVEPGKTLALVGASGCGKSTVISLIERFYDPTYGTVMIDDMDVRSINLRHMRNYIGLVTQEPVLFDCSIKDNIAYGLGAADQLHADQVFNSVMQAARTANIHNFIVSLPKGYDTLVGERGTQLSGGQKQRIAIARALIRDPKILLLDEATSALDTENEKIVQEALDRVREGRTCIIVAHRVSTIQNADCIAVIHRGKIVEQGTHESLKNKEGRYSHLIGNQ